jgi:DNA-directed RNA polymerase specialized sigma subunit
MPASNEKQLEEIKRLLMVLLFKLGSTSDEIAIALNVNSSRVRQIMPTKKIEKIFNERKKGPLNG